MPVDNATSSPVLQPAAAAQPQASDLTAQPAGPPRAQASDRQQSAPTVAGAAIEDRAMLDRPSAPRREVQGAGMQDGSELPTTLLEGAMKWGVAGFLDLQDKARLGPMQREFHTAIKTQSNPHDKAAFAAIEEHRRNPNQQTSDAAAAAIARSKAHHREVGAFTENLTRSYAALRTEIEESNRSHSIGYKFEYLSGFLEATLRQSGQSQKTIEVCELGMAYREESPTCEDYVNIARTLLNAGRFSLAVQLLTRVMDPKKDFPAFDYPLAHPLHFGLAPVLAQAQLLMGDCSGALRTAEAHPGEPQCTVMAAVAYYKLAMAKPEGADRTDLLAASDARLKTSIDPSHVDASRLGELAGIYFDMGRVAEGLHCLERAAPSLLLRYLPDRPSVRHSPQRDLIFASLAWDRYARNTGEPNPVHTLLDRESVDVSFDLPAIIAPPRHKILSVRDLEAR